MKFFTIISMIALIVSCSNSNLLTSITSDPSKSSKSSTAASSGRPSEDGESVPGYLTDPSLVIVTVDGNRVIIEGEMDSINAQGEGSVTGVHINILSTSNNSFEKAVISGSEESADTVTTSTPSEDGNFKIEFEVNDGKAILFEVGSTADGKFSIPKDNSIKSTLLFVDQINGSLTLPPILIRESDGNLDATVETPISDVETTLPEPEATIPAPAPLTEYEGQRNECNSKNRYYSPYLFNCSALAIIPVSNCQTPRNTELFLQEARATDEYQGKANVITEIEQLIAQGYEIDQCYDLTPLTKSSINVVFIKSEDGDITDAETVTVSRSAYVNLIQN